MTCPLEQDKVDAIRRLLTSTPPMPVELIARQTGVSHTSVRRIRDGAYRVERAPRTPAHAGAGDVEAFVDALGLDLTEDQMRELLAIRQTKRLGKTAEPIDTGEFRQQDEIRNIY